MTDSDKPDPQTLPFLKAWDSYAAACQTLFERLSDGSAADAGAPTPLAFLGLWKDFAAKLGMPADVAAGEHFKPEHMFSSYLPALGYSRDYQEITRRMLDLSVQFQSRCAAFAQQGVDIGRCALQAIQKRSSGDRTMDGSPAAIYDAWIDCAEEAYAQAAHTEPFARLLADICNTLSAFKIERGRLLEALARHLDWPSRGEVDSLHRQVRNLTAAAAKTAQPTTAAPRNAPKTAAGGKTTAGGKRGAGGKPAGGVKPAGGGKPAGRVKTTAKAARAARAGKVKARRRAGR